MTRDSDFRYWCHHTRINSDGESVMSRALRILDKLDAQGLNEPVDTSSPQIDPILDPGAIIKSTIFRKWGKWHIEFYKNGQKTITPLNTKHKHIAMIKQETIDATLSKASRVPEMVPV